MGWFSGLPDPSYETIVWFFLCCGSESQSGAELDVGYMGVHNEQVSAVSANGAEKSETRIETLEQTFTGASLNGKGSVLHRWCGEWFLPNHPIYWRLEWHSKDGDDYGLNWESGQKNSSIFIKREMWNWTKEFFFFPLKFQWLKNDICQCCSHHRSLEARSRTWILQKIKQGYQYFNWNLVSTIIKYTR